MNQIPENIYGIIAKSFSEKLDEQETAELENWKLSSSENLKEYNDFVSIWTQSASLKMPNAINEPSALNTIRNNSGIFSSRKRWINWLTQAAAVLVLSIVFSGIYNYLNKEDHENIVTESSSLPVYQEVKAAYGTQAKVELADGTIVYLNSGSKLRFPLTFENQKQRKVNLDGEGYFSVTKMKQHPFIVETSQMNIRVLGTIFNVDAYSDNSMINVALVKGSVELQQNIGENTEDLMKLAPNQVASLNKTDKTLVKTDVDDLNKYTAWINGRIVFYDDPIQTVVKKLGKWYNVDITISDKRLENYRFTGTFMDESLEQILSILSRTSPMSYVILPLEKQGDGSMSKRKIILKSKS